MPTLVVSRMTNKTARRRKRYAKGKEKRVAGWEDLTLLDGLDMDDGMMRTKGMTKDRLLNQLYRQSTQN